MRLGITAFLTDRAMAPADLARAAEERGFHSLYLPEHTHLPVRADHAAGAGRGGASRTTTGAASTRSWPCPPRRR